MENYVWFYFSARSNDIIVRGSAAHEVLLEINRFGAVGETVHLFDCILLCLLTLLFASGIEIFCSKIVGKDLFRLNYFYAFSIYMHLSGHPDVCPNSRERNSS